MTLAQNIAHWMFFEGTHKTTEGNYCFSYEKVEKTFECKLTPELIESITDELLSNIYVIDVCGPEDTGDNAFDVNFSTLFTAEAMDIINDHLAEIYD